MVAYAINRPMAVLVSAPMLAEGTIVGTYRILRKLGEGGMGAVFIGEHTLLGRKAAIKVLLPELSTHQEIVQRFFNEAKAVTQIADPGIVQVFDFGYHTDGSAFIIMELLEGEPMDRRLARIGRFQPHEAVRLMRLICTSLAAAHAKGIVHRDLKPENIFLVGDPAVTGGERAKILDFGIAKLTGDDPGQLKTRTGMVMGTPVYMSPEQCRGISIDPRSDIYSIGCVLMTMLTGQPPFQGEGSGDLIAAHLREPPPYAAARVPGLPEVFDQILQCCLAKSPDHRFPTMMELTQALGHVEQLLYHSMSAGASSPRLAIPTPLPGSLPTVPGTLPRPTTLTGAAAQSAGATGQSMGAPSRRRGWLAGGAVVGVVVVAAIVVAATRGRGAGDSENHAASPAGAQVTVPAVTAAGATGTATAASPGTPTRPAPDTTVTGNPTASNAVPPAATDAAVAGSATPANAVTVTATTTGDAGVGTTAEAVIDAGPTKTVRPHKDERKRTPGGNHARPNAENSTSPMDRGD
jgi:serine/threonine-protein kinase